MPKTTAKSAAERVMILSLIEKMKEVSIDQIFTHQNVLEVLPENYHDSKRYLIVSRARTIMNQESGIVFATVSGVGYRRLGGATGVDYTGQQSLGKICNVARRGGKFLGNAMHHANDMTTSDRRLGFSRMATLGLINHLTLASTVNTMPVPDEPHQASNPMAGLEQLRKWLGL